MKKFPKRSIFVGVFLLVCMMGLLFRLADIQLFSTESFGPHHINLIKDSIKQRTKGIVLDDGRGQLLDKNGHSLFKQTKPSLILFPFISETKWPINEVAKIIHSSPNQLKQALNDHSNPFTFEQSQLTLTQKQVEQINQLKIPGVFAMPMKPSGQNSIAPHLIGLVKQNPSLVKSRYPDLLKKGLITSSSLVGISGLEKAYDMFLFSRDDKELLYHTTNAGLPLFGPQVKYTAPANPYFPLNVVTTVDKSIQKIANDAVAQAGLKRGGVVILDALNSNLLAMVSRPVLDPNQPFAKGGQNLMLEPQFPGSVFKVVTASAAIDKNIVKPNQWFNCNLNMYESGPSKRQLGSLTFSQSFAESCNETFAQLGQKLITSDDHILDKTANKLGLTEKNGWTGDVFHLTDFKQFPNEKQNTIWANNSNRQVKKAMRQTAIGQLNVKLTPLSVANMMATIARGGEKWTVRNATEVTHKDGSIVVTFPHQKIDTNQLSPYTIMQLQGLLKSVVDNPKGTAHKLVDLPYEVAGKSGTAQTGKNHTNQWFAGYFPFDNPRYAMVVVDLDSHPGQNRAYTIYSSIVKSLYHYDQK